MAWFGQGKDTIEWEDSREDVLFFKWPGKEIKKGSKLIIRPGQKAIFYASGQVEGIFEYPGEYDIESDIVPFLSTLSGIFSLRGDSGMRAEVYFINSRELVARWGTQQRLLIPTPEVPSGVPVGMNGQMVLEFSDYERFIDKIAGIRDEYTLADISERLVAQINPIIAEAILGGQPAVGLNVLAQLQQNSRELGKKLAPEMDSELLPIGLTVKSVAVQSVNYPQEVQQMVEKVAGRAMVGDVGKFAAISMAEGLEKGGGGDVASLGAQLAMGQQMAAAFTQQQPAPAQPEAQGDRFCPKCRKMTSGKFCSDCGTETV